MKTRLCTKLCTKRLLAAHSKSALESYLERPGGSEGLGIDLCYSGLVGLHPTDYLLA